MRGVFEGRAADANHDLVVLQPRQFERPPLIRSTGSSSLLGYSPPCARPAVRPGRSVRRIEQAPAFRAHRQVGEAAGPMSGRSMLAAVRVGRERGDRIDLGEAAQSAYVRPIRQCDRGLQ